MSEGLGPGGVEHVIEVAHTKQRAVASSTHYTEGVYNFPHSEAGLLRVDLI